MSFGTLILLLIAGFAGGVMNSMAGGATLVTFPAMLSAGLPPIVANATNTLSTSSFTLTAALREWRVLPARNGYFWTACASALVGGLIGGALLMATDERLFEFLVPVLIGGGTFLFAFAKHIQAWLSRKFGNLPAWLAPALLFPVCIYGGYFGAGLGVLVMASLLATSRLGLQPTNAFKNLLGPIANFAAIPVFLWHDAIAWLPALVMFVGGFAGAQYGVHLFRSLPEADIRRGIIIVGVIMTLIYTWRNWF